MESEAEKRALETAVGPELPPRLLAKLRVEVPGYQLLDEIGSGGQATVYRARELTSNLTVAIKILLAGANADENARERFRRETAALKALNHPNIVCVIESGQTLAGLDFLVMNFIDGKPLDVLWKDRKVAAKIAPEPPARLRLFKKICDVVQAAHRAGITHRDLSPSNILLDDRGEPQVLDFGLAATAFDSLMSPGGRNITVTGQFIGKLKYASPEQARGTRESIDIRTDVYALGVILYQILTNGAFPYEVVGNVVDVLNNIIHSKPTPPSALLAAREAPTISVTPGKERTVLHGPPLVNETIEAVVLKALEKDPNLRYGSAGALGEDIERYLAGTPTTARPKRETSADAAKQSRSYSLRAVLITTLSTILAIGVVMNARTILAWLGLTAVTASVAAAPHPRAASSAQQKLVEHLARTETHVGIVEKHLGTAAAQLGNAAADGNLPPGVIRARKLLHHHLLPLPWNQYLRRVPGSVIVENNLIADSARDGAAQQEEEVAALGNDLDALWAQRAKLEQERMVLWAKIAFRAVADQEFSDQPLYRFELTSKTPATSIDQHIEAIRAVGQFVRVVDHLSTEAQDAVDTDPRAVYLMWHTHLVAARAKMQDTLLSQAELAMDVYKPTTDAGQMSAAAKQLVELAQTMVDAEQALAAAEKAGDDEEADASRAQLQDALADTAGAVETLDQSVAHAATAWGVTGVPGTKAASGQFPDISVGTPTPPRETVIAADPSGGWVDLFNGRDLAGWGAPQRHPSDWRVEDGVLVARGLETTGILSNLPLPRFDYTDFDLRVEAMVNDHGQGGIIFRREAGTWRAFNTTITGSGENPHQTGSLHAFGWAPPDERGGGQTWLSTVNDAPPANQWCTIEIIALGKRITIAVNGKTVTDFTDSNNYFPKGGIALEVATPASVVKFRKVQIRELTADGSPRAAANAGQLSSEIPATPTVAPGGSTSPNGNGVLPSTSDPLSPSPPAPPAVAEGAILSDRQIAERVLNLGGQVTVSTGAGRITAKDVDHLPQGTLVLVEVKLVRNEAVTDSKASFLASAASLELLNLGDTEITDQTLEDVVSKLGKLRSLYIPGTKITSQGLTALQMLSKLEDLSVGRTQITDLQALSKMRQLKILSLWFCPLTDQSIGALAELSNLNSLCLRGTHITNEGLASLRGLSSLTELDLTATTITDDGLATLSELSNLKQIKDGKTTISDAAVKRLFPNCEIVH